MVSISDVAQRAGVSPTTVSHALSGKRKVGEATRQRVIAAMEDLGYAPRSSAQSLALGTTNIIALVVPDISNGFFAELAAGVEEQAVASGYNVLLCTTGFDHERELRYLEMIRSRAVDGVVYATGAPPTHTELSRLLGNIPLVQVDEVIPGVEAPTVISDNYNGGRLVAEHLLDLGHTNALVLSAHSNLESSRRRTEGFTDTWNERQGTSVIVAHGGFTEFGGKQALTPYLGKLVTGEITSIFAVNDLMALGVIEELNSVGLLVPEQISVVGFDDIATGRFSRPALTTVHQQVHTLGTVATTRLTDLLKKKGQPEVLVEVLPVELIVRGSSGRRSEYDFLRGV